MRTASGSGATPKRPIGVITSSVWPGLIASPRSAEKRPPAIFFTATRSSPSSSPEQIE